MKILVIGASQGTGALSVKAALDKGHEVTAFARSPQKLALDHPRLTKRVGDFHDPASVEAAVPGHDAVIITASATSLKAFRADPTCLSFDLFHPSARGYAVWADALLPAVRAALAAG